MAASTLTTPVAPATPNQGVADFNQQTVQDIMSAPSEKQVIEVIEVEPEPVATPEPKVLTVEEKIQQASEEYGIDPDVAIAIAKLETGHFTSDAYKYHHNVGGMMSKGKVMHFANDDEGVDRFVSNISKNYWSKGLTTPEAMSHKYCPPTADEWARTVRQMMQE